ncbi:histone deacetylase family protein [Rhodobacteraceae bacterium RKSG542]|uniref:histone deacetylase family protein n=1 Tax=Pseudovibrio flavus TaxID=2529854 RepID=UPI0012BD6062|nr:histone deacetylase family protein [Pseudovibrio flavus]MTI18740.1 histone deacetylase family protein [Pseudovibrio flavus]
MSTLLVQHPAFLNHLTPIGHPERADRLRAIDRVLEDEHFQLLERDIAPMATFAEVALVHPSSYINAIHNQAPKEGLVHLDADTTMSPGTWEAAMRAVGACCKATEEIMTGRVRNAFCSIRPPGHHAEKNRAMGFCYFNNAAIAARHAQKNFGAERVVILDFDVHHGNGTQDIFWDDPTVMYVSTHQAPLYPGTGLREETGEHNNIVNVPLKNGDGSAEFRDAIENIILPRMEAFDPDFIVLSSGFDAHTRDPLGGLRLTEHDFAWVTREAMNLAQKKCDSRVLSVLEGGYDLEGLARSVASHVMTLMDP